jgi:hypothetical protein
MKIFCVCSIGLSLVLAPAANSAARRRAGHFRELLGDEL